LILWEGGREGGGGRRRVSGSTNTDDDDDDDDEGKSNSFAREIRGSVRLSSTPRGVGGGSVARLDGEELDHDARVVVVVVAAAASSVVRVAGGARDGNCVRDASSSLR
tara:strand:- start:2499 stop:2822 length:324 start_codon:yes stop_codon:yes gene_type:complete